MDFYSSTLLSLGLAADACAVSLTIGLTIRNIKVNKAIKVALFFGLFQAAMPLLGWLAGLTFRDLLDRFDHWIIFIILTILGGKMIYESLTEPESSKNTKFNFLETYTLIALSLATSIDALAAGLGFSIVQTSIVSTAVIIGLITFILSGLAVYIGHFFGDLLKQKIEVLGGAILIFLGVKILFQDFV